MIGPENEEIKGKYEEKKSWQQVLKIMFPVHLHSWHGRHNKQNKK